MEKNPAPILIVDDNLDYSESLARLLEMLGYQATFVTDGKQAVTEFTQSRPRLVLLDIGLPDMSGYSVAKQIRDLDAEKATQVIAITGGNKVFDYGELDRCGFDGCLHKPVSISDLNRFLLKLAAT